MLKALYICIPLQDAAFSYTSAMQNPDPKAPCRYYLYTLGPKVGTIYRPKHPRALG